ncbi:Moesin [Fusarium oxysporum f. sp. albedinis]|nr:Moesin [Fusarium oxysporum f. sp. albedinis]
MSQILMVHLTAAVLTTKRGLKAYATQLGYTDMSHTATGSSSSPRGPRAVFRTDYYFRMMVLDIGVLAMFHGHKVPGASSNMICRTSHGVRMIEELTEYKDARTFQTPMVYFIPYRDKPFWLKSLLVFCCVAYVGMFAWRSLRGVRCHEGSTSLEPQVTLQHEPSLGVIDQNAGLVANKLTTTLGPKGSRGAMLSDSSGQERL